jgi:hypothetical protein
VGCLVHGTPGRYALAEPVLPEVCLRPGTQLIVVVVSWGPVLLAWAPVLLALIVDCKCNPLHSPLGRSHV